jgi:hypothetical protein
MIAEPMFADTYTVTSDQAAQAENNNSDSLTTVVTATVVPKTPAIVIPTDDDDDPTTPPSNNNIIINTPTTPPTTPTASSSSSAGTGQLIAGSQENNDDKRTSAAQMQEDQDAVWPWLLAGLVAAALAGLIPFIWRNKHWIKEMTADEDNVMHYWANGDTPLGYYDKYFDVKIADFEQHKHAHLMEYILETQPDFKVGDTFALNGFLITAYADETSHDFKHFEIVREPTQ